MNVPSRHLIQMSLSFTGTFSLQYRVLDRFDFPKNEVYARDHKIVLIGSEVYSIVTYLLSEDGDDSNSDCCASVVVTKGRKLRHEHPYTLTPLHLLFLYYDVIF